MRRVAFVLVTVITSVAAYAQLEVKELKLSNGMTVWLNEDHSQPKVFGAVVVKAGAKDCPNTGIAHYFEHIMFKGTDRIGTTDYAAEKPWLDSISAQYDLLSQTKDETTRTRIQKHINELSIKAADYVIPNEYSRLISKYGGSSLNAGTGQDLTYYHNSFLPQFMEQWCWLNSERLMTPVFRGFQGELENVYEEKNRAADDMGDVQDKIFKAVFKTQPYAYPVLGSTENLKNPRLSDMAAFFKKYYVASNMCLILCGDIRPDAALVTLLEKTFGRVQTGPVPVTILDDDDRELTRCVVEEWIDNKDDEFYESITPVIRHCLSANAQLADNLSILKPYAFVLEDDDREAVAELYVVDGDTVIVDPDLMEGLDKDLDDFLENLLKS